MAWPASSRSSLPLGFGCWRLVKKQHGICNKKKRKVSTWYPIDYNRLIPVSSNIYSNGIQYQYPISTNELISNGHIKTKTMATDQLRGSHKTAKQEHRFHLIVESHIGSDYIAVTTFLLVISKFLLVWNISWQTSAKEHIKAARTKDGREASKIWSIAEAPSQTCPAEALQVVKHVSWFNHDEDGGGKALKNGCMLKFDACLNLVRHEVTPVAKCLDDMSCLWLGKRMQLRDVHLKDTIAGKQGWTSWRWF